MGDATPDNDAAPQAPRIFLSYRSNKQAWVKIFSDPMLFANVIGNVVVEDYLTNNRHAFGPLGEWLDRHISCAAVVVAFVSKDYCESEWTQAEWETSLTAAQRGRLIFVPIMMHADAKAWWRRAFQKPGYRNYLPPDFQFADFTENGTELLFNKPEHSLRVVNVAEKIKELLAVPRLPSPPPLPPPSADVVLLGHPTVRQDDDVAIQADALATTLQTRAVRVQRWKDGWRKADKDAEHTQSRDISSLFVQPLVAEEAKDLAGQPDKIGAELHKKGIANPRVTLWLPRTQSDKTFEQAVTADNSDHFPALRHDTPQALGDWLAQLVKPEIDLILQIETIGTSEDTEFDVLTSKLADQVCGQFRGVVRSVIVPEPMHWPFIGFNLLKDQIAGLPGKRAIVAVHDLDANPSGNTAATQEHFKKKFRQIHDAVEEARKESDRTRELKLFFTALAAMKPNAVPWTFFPTPGYEHWRILHFEKEKPAEDNGANRHAPMVHPAPDSARAFRKALQEWKAS